MVTLLTHTPEPDKVVAIAARLCYSSDSIEELGDKMSPKKIETLVKKLIEMGHESPIEHVTFTFGIEGVSRALSHQLVRHRLANYSMRSQRYVKENGFPFITPPSIYAQKRALDIFNDTMTYLQLSYNMLTEMGIPQEDARYVLPNACQTSLILTMNARSLYNFFSHRLCIRSQWEIRKLAEEMLDILKTVSPLLFSNVDKPCIALGYCPEKGMSCGYIEAIQRNKGKEGSE